MHCQHAIGRRKNESPYKNRQLHLYSLHSSQPLQSASLESQISKMSAKIAVITWSLYGHVAELANDAIEGAKAAGAEVKQFQVSVPAMKKRKAISS